MVPSKVSFQLRSHCNHLKNTSPQDIVKFLSMPYKFLHDLAPAHLSSPYLFSSHPGALLPPPPHTCTYSLELTYYLHQFVHHSHNKKSFFISAENDIPISLKCLVNLYLSCKMYFKWHFLFTAFSFSPRNIC